MRERMRVVRRVGAWASEGGGAMVLMPWCYAARNGLVRLVVRWPVGTGALSDTAALGGRGTSVLQRSCSASDEGLR